MKINYKIHNKMLLVKIEGEIDEYSGDYIRKNLEQIFLDSAPEKVVFDLSNVSFMDSTGIGIMIGRYKSLHSKKIPCYILNPSLCVEKIFSMTKLYDLMPKIEQC